MVSLFTYRQPRRSFNTTRTHTHTHTRRKPRCLALVTAWFHPQVPSIFLKDAWDADDCSIVPAKYRHASARGKVHPHLTLFPKHGVPGANPGFGSTSHRLKSRRGSDRCGRGQPTRHHLWQGGASAESQGLVLTLTQNSQKLQLASGVVQTSNLGASTLAWRVDSGHVSLVCLWQTTRPDLAFWLL